MMIIKSKYPAYFAIGFTVFALMLVWARMTGEFEQLQIGSWVVAEWLINYSGGFVRRGLAGSILFQLGEGEDLLHLLYKASLLFYVLYCILFYGIYTLAKIKQPILLLVAVLLPGSIFQMGFVNQFFNRKEMLFLILFGILCLLYLIALRISSQYKERCLTAMFFFAVVGGSVMVLIHEGYLFMSYPLTLLLLWIVWKENPDKQLLPWLYWIYAILIPVIFMLCVQHRGSPELALSIWESLSLSDRLSLSPDAPYTVFGPIYSISWGFIQNWLTIYGIFATNGWIYWLIFIIGNGFALLYLITRLQIALLSESTNNSYRFSAYLFLGLLLSVLMFLIAADWGRWIAYASNSLLLFAFTMTQSTFLMDKTATKFPRCIQSLSKSSILNSKFSLWVIILYALLFALPECCINPRYIIMPYEHFFSAFFL